MRIVFCEIRTCASRWNCSNSAKARMENLRLRSMLDFRTKAEGTYLVARVVARDPNRVLNTVLLDLGETDGVRKRMPVVTADGLVGRVLEVHPQTAVVQLLLDRNCRVSAIVQRDERTSGIVTCRKRQVFSQTRAGAQRGVRRRQDYPPRAWGVCFPRGFLLAWYHGWENTIRHFSEKSG